MTDEAIVSQFLKGIGKDGLVDRVYKESQKTTKGKLTKKQARAKVETVLLNDYLERYLNRKGD